MQNATLLFPDAAKVWLANTLNAAVTALAPNPLFALTKGDWVPDVNATAADITAHEADYTGYSRANMFGFVSPPQMIAGHAVLSDGQEQWTTANPLLQGCTIGAQWLLAPDGTPLICWSLTTPAVIDSIYTYVAMMTRWDVTEINTPATPTG